MPGKDLSLRTIQDALKDEAAARRLEELTGMDRQEISQFVDQFEGAPEIEPGEGREVAVEPGEDEALDPNRTLENPLTSVGRSQQVGRNDRPSADDGLGQNRQGGGSPPPPEFRRMFEAYQRRLSSGSTPEAPPAPAARPSTGAGSDRR